MAKRDYRVEGYAWESKVPLIPLEGERPAEMIERLKASGDVLEHYRSVTFNYDSAVNKGLIGWETVEAYIATFRDEETYPYISVKVDLTKL